ncbi:MAG: SH3-like domain-containing protein [Acetobacteraceae bacterium]
MAEQVLAPGTAVRVADRPAFGHCRTPFYLRGRRGVVTEFAGRFRNPEQLAYHRPGLPALPLYRVRFPYVAPDGTETTDEIVADIYGHWLEAEQLAP